MEPSVRTTGTTTEELYEAHFSFVWSSLHRLGVPVPALEDATHDVFVVVHRRLRQFDGSSRVRTWLYGIARRVAADRRRGELRRHRRLEALCDAPRPVFSLETLADQRRALRLVEGFIDRLDEAKREVFVLSHLEQMSGPEVALALSLNPNTAAARLRAARKEFERWLTHNECLLDTELVCELARRRRGPAAAKRRVMAGLLPLLELPSPPAAPWFGRFRLTAASAVAVAGAVSIAMVTASRFTQPPTRVRSGLAATVRCVDAPEQVGAGAVLPSFSALPVWPEALPSVSMAAGAGVRSPPAPPESPPKRAVRPPPRRTPIRAHDEASSPTEPAGSGDLAQQTRLARRVASSGDPAQKLALVGEYHRRWPDGFFAERLASEELTALCELGRDVQARRRARALLSRYPGSSLLPRDSTRPCPNSIGDTDRGASGH